jgi:hypothetical protein
VYSITANVPFSRSFTGNGNFFNLIFANGNVGTTSTLNINTAYGTLQPSTNLGNLPVSLDEVNGTTLSLGRKVNSLSLPVVQAKNNIYFAAVNNLTVAPNATDIFNISGSPLKTVILKSLKISGTQNVTGNIVIRVLKKSTGNSGTGTILTSIPASSLFPSSVVNALVYNSNPTLGTILGALNVTQLLLQASNGIASAQQIELLTDDIILNNANDCISINLFGTQTIPGSNIHISAT